jgi:hypothetical protein
MWIVLTNMNGSDSYVNINIAIEMYRHSGNKKTILSFADGVEIHVKETPIEIFEKMNRYV